MSKPLRIEFEGALYHVTSRGDRREKIFKGDKNREAFYELINIYKIRAIVLILYSIVIIYLGIFLMNLSYLIEWFKGEKINFDNSIDFLNTNIKEINNQMRNQQFM